MTALSFTRILTVCAAAAIAALAASPVAAETSAPAAEATPLKLKTFMRKPVANSATRTVKKKNGEYAKVAVKSRAKPHLAAPAVTPASLSPAAAQAFAAYELARVRIVTPEEAADARLLADAAAHATRVVGVDNVQIVSAHEVNDIDRKADSQAAVSLDALSRDLAGSRGDFYAPAEPKAEGETWFQRLLMVFGGAFASVAALVRMLLG